MPINSEKCTSLHGSKESEKNKNPSFETKYDILRSINNLLTSKSKNTQPSSEFYVTPPFASKETGSSCLSYSVSDAEKYDNTPCRCEPSNDMYLSPSSFSLSLENMKLPNFTSGKGGRLQKMGSCNVKSEGDVPGLNDSTQSALNYQSPVKTNQNDRLGNVTETAVDDIGKSSVENVASSKWEPVQLIRKNAANEKCFYCGKEDPNVYVVPRLIIICEGCSESFDDSEIRRIEHIMNMDVVNLLVLLGNAFIPSLPIPNMNLSEQLFKSICNDDLSQTHRLLLAGANPASAIGSLSALSLAAISDHPLQTCLLKIHGGKETVNACDQLEEELKGNSPRINRGFLCNNVLSLSKDNKIRYVLNLHEFIAIYTFLQPLQIRSQTKPEFTIYVGEKRHVFYFSDVKQYFRWLKAVLSNVNVSTLGKLSTLSVLHGDLMISESANEEPEKAILAIHKPSEMSIFSMRRMKTHGSLLRLDLRKIVSSKICDSELIVLIPPYNLHFSANRHLTALHNFFQKVLNTPKPTELYTQLLTPDDVPVLISKCLNYIFINGLLTDGIYRISGSESQVRTILSIANPYDIQFTSVHDAATVLRRFLRSLSEPVLFPILRHRDDERPLSVLSKVAFATIKKLFFNLRTIVEFSDRNRMTANSLAVIFTPCLLGNDDALPASIAFVRDMIENCERHFDGLDEELRLAKLAIKMSEKQEVPANPTLLIPVFFLKRNEEAALNVPADLSVNAIVSRILSAFCVHDSWLWSLFEVINTLERPLAPYDKIDITRKGDFCVKPNYLLPNPSKDVAPFESIEINGKIKNIAVKQATLIISDELSWRLEDIELYVDSSCENTLVCIHCSNQIRSIKFSSRNLMISWFWILLSPPSLESYYRDGPHVPPVIPKQLTHLRH